jgi:hypothetical protein
MKYIIKPHKDKINSGYAALILIASILVGLAIDTITFN